MKIISGRFGSRKIRVPKTILRPTTDKVKEAVFSSLADTVNKTICLDLFCGSGALGLEALSRGAERAFFVDEDLACFKSLEKTLESLGFERINNRKICDAADVKLCQSTRTFKFPESGQQAVLIKTRVNYGIRFLKEQNIKFDIILADPPYSKLHDNSGPDDSHLSQRCLDDIVECKILADSGIFILEHYIQDNVTVPEELNLFKQKKYGDTFISFYQL